MTTWYLLSKSISTDWRLNFPPHENILTDFDFGLWISYEKFKVINKLRLSNITKYTKTADAFNVC